MGSKTVGSASPEASNPVRKDRQQSPIDDGTLSVHGLHIPPAVSQVGDRNLIVAPPEGLGRIVTLSDRGIDSQEEGVLHLLEVQPGYGEELGLVRDHGPSFLPIRDIYPAFGCPEAVMGGDAEADRFVLDQPLALQREGLGLVSTVDRRIMQTFQVEGLGVEGGDPHPEGEGAEVLQAEVVVEVKARLLPVDVKGLPDAAPQIRYSAGGGHRPPRSRYIPCPTSSGKESSWWTFHPRPQ